MLDARVAPYQTLHRNRLGRFGVTPAVVAKHKNDLDRIGSFFLHLSEFQRKTWVQRSIRGAYSFLGLGQVTMNVNLRLRGDGS